MRFCLALALSWFAGCSSSSSSADHPGSADVQLARAGGDVEAIAITGPPGELRLTFVENGSSCSLQLNAAEPRRGDLGTDAKRTRRVLLVDLPLERIPASRTGAASETTIAPPAVLVGDATVRLERGRPDEDIDGWYAVGGGTARVGALVKDGDVLLELVDVPVKALAGNVDMEPRMLRASVHARYEGFITLGPPSGACPTDLPGR